jgi:23S rRNA (cytidine2498-2'-O)-methyltransferase
VSQSQSQSQSATGYLAPEGFVEELRTELGEVSASYGRLLISPGPPKPAAWVANIWLDPVELPIASVGDAAKRLRAIQRNWALYPHAQHRRASLIEAKLPKVSARPLVFPAAAPAAPLGSWTLVDANTLLVSARCTSPFANGAARFVEDKRAPPSRAYLKLWEALTLLGAHPKPGELCLDLGSSPGGWTWVLATLGARVISVDKAPLDPAVAAMPGVEVRRESAFGLDPRAIGSIDWLFSDVICYPARLLRLVERWLELGTCRRFVCTLKFQGATDHGTVRRFAAIAGSRLLHLHHNKHELTWVMPA